MREIILGDNDLRILRAIADPDGNLASIVAVSELTNQELQAALPDLRGEDLRMLQGYLGGG